MAGKFLKFFSPMVRVMPEIKQPQREVRFKEKLEIKERKKESKKESKKEQKKPKKRDEEQSIPVSEAAVDSETVVLDTIKEIESVEGAPWDSIVEKCKKEGLDENSIEEALTSLMDKGFIFEPVLGTLKST